MTDASNLRSTNLTGWGRVDVGFRTKSGIADRAEILMGGSSVFLERPELEMLATSLRKWLDTGEHT